MKLHHLNCGTMCPASPRFVLGRGAWTGRARMVCHCLLVESRAGLALVDTGLGTADLADPSRLGSRFVRRNAPPLDPRETALEQVRGLGLDPRDVRHVLPTHFDVDHVGGLSDFPDASVHVLEAELEAATSGPRRPHYRPVQWAHGPRFVRHRVQGESWMGFDAVRALPGTEDEILIVPLAGHSAGHAGIAVRAAGGWLLHAGDAYFDRDEIDPVRPRAGMGISIFRRLYAVDEDARRANVERLRVLARDHASEVRVFSAHCADELDALRAERGPSTGGDAVSAV